MPMILDWQASAGSIEFYLAIGFEPDFVGDMATHPGFTIDLRSN